MKKMYHKSNSVKFFVFFILFMKKIVFCEWIEMPEFSDNEKVYRVPFTKYEREKLSEGYLNAQKYAFPNNSSIFLKNAQLTTEKTLINIQMTTSKQEIIIEMPKLNTEEIKNLAKSDKSNININYKMNNSINQEVIDDKIHQQTIEIDKSEKEEDLVISNEEESTSENPDYVNNDKNNEGNTFLQNFPVELFKKVHKTLTETRPTSFRGKMEFLGSIKRTLLNAIRSKLMALVSPVRRKRGSAWEEDDVGFPSLEGALLAISFLTFAVYLVQLVMMLFRNLGPAPVATNTVVVNRNKRTSADVTEEAARILQYLDEFKISQEKIALSQQL